MSHRSKLSIYQFRLVILFGNTRVFYSALGSTEYKIILLNSQHNGHCWSWMDHVLHGLAAMRWSGVWNVMDLPTKQKIILNPLLFCCPYQISDKEGPQQICKGTKIRKSESDLGGVRIKNKVLRVALTHGQAETYSRKQKRRVSRIEGSPLDLPNAWYLLSSVLPIYSAMKQHRLWGVGILLDFFFFFFYDRVFQFRIFFLSY